MGHCHYSKQDRSPVQSVASDPSLQLRFVSNTRRLAGLSELQRRFSMVCQFCPKLSGDLNRCSGLEVVGDLCSPAECVLHPSGSTDGVLEIRRVVHMTHDVDVPELDRQLNAKLHL